jgi:3-phosphoshikimate 1-carboxyvinyltransferase
MLAAMGAPVEVKDLSVIVKGSERDTKLHPLDMQIPADFSSAAFFISAALIVPNSRILMKSVGVNLTRTGLLEVIRAMGGDVAIENERIISGEPVADISCMTAPNLKATRIGKELIPSLIDEFPVLCVLATQAEGVTEIRGADDLRVKESDRIAAMASEMRKFGVLLEEYPDGIAIQGKSLLKGCVVESFGDHRIAMALSVLALMAEGITTIRNASCVGISFPKFFDQLSRLYA